MQQVPLDIADIQSCRYFWVYLLQSELNLLLADPEPFAYLPDSAAELVLCRRILQSSCVLGYYLQGSNEQHR